MNIVRCALIDDATTNQTNIRTCMLTNTGLTVIMFVIEVSLPTTYEYLDQLYIFLT